MDFFQHRYYRTTKILMSVIGQWPDQTIRARRGSLAVVIFLSVSLYLALIMALVKYHDDWEILNDTISAIVMVIFCFIKLITFMCNSKKTLKLLNHIRADWLVWAEDREVNILHEYAEQGRNYVMVYTVTMYSILMILLAQPIIPKIIDVLLNNGSKTGRLPSPAYYYHVDIQKYYFYVYIYTYVCWCVLVTLHVTNDVVLIVYVRHGCGIFAALGHKLERIGKNEKSADVSYYSEKRYRTLEHLIRSCIARHNDAIEYTKLIDTSYSWVFFVTMIFRLAIINIIGLQIVSGTSERQEIFRCVGSALWLISYVYMESYAAQVLTDHSINIRNHIQNGRWYSLSLKAQKLLLMIIMRCNVPCRLTAGHFFHLSVESFVVFLKTAMSYLTVLRSMQSSFGEEL